MLAHAQFTGSSLSVFNENENISARSAYGAKAGMQPKRGLQDITNAAKPSNAIGKKQVSHLVL